MNQRASGSMTIKKAIVGFVNEKYAEGLSKLSIDSCERILHKWIHQNGDKEISKVSTKELRAYL